jgi:hypothetical protein
LLWIRIKNQERAMQKTIKSNDGPDAIGYMKSIGLGDALQKAGELCSRFGYKKHGEDRWRYRTSEHHMQAAQRHLDAAFEGGAGALDESGSAHLIHAAVRCLMAAGVIGA